jgi:hypothetical protein
MVATKGAGEYVCACRVVCTSTKQFHSALLDTISDYISVYIVIPVN